jgi:hypothetical protein
MASPDNTIIHQGGSFTDAHGNIWSINANAQATENGQLAGYTAGVVEMAFEQGQVWQENGQGLWWEWDPSAPDNYTGWSPTAGTATSPVVPSPNGTIVYPNDGTIIDAQGNTWTVNANAQVTENGQLAGYSAGVVALAYENRNIWQENDQHLWWDWNPSAPGNYTGWSQSAGTAPPSQSGVIVYPGDGTIVDAQGNRWSINADAQVTENGQPAGHTAGVVEMADENGSIWQENGQGLWWEWNPSAPDNYTGWSPSAGATTSPVTPTTRTWLGGGNNAASNPNDWSPAGLPQPGDTLIITQGTIVVSGNDLAGNVLSVLYPANGGPTPTIDVQNAQVDLDAASPVPIGGGLTINVAGNDQISFLSPRPEIFTPTFDLAANSSVTLTGDNFFFIYSFHGGAGSELINDGTLRYNQTGSIIDTNIAGTGTIDVSRAHDGSASLEVNGSVGSGQTFAMQTSSFSANLIVDQPEAFGGRVVVEPDPYFSLASILLKGLNATSFDLTNDLLRLYDGNQSVDTLRLTNNAGEPLTVQETGSGVMIVAGNAGLGQILPPHVS